MRVDLTIDHDGERRFDVALTGSQGMRMRDVLPQLRALAGADDSAQAWVAGNPVTATSIVGHEPLLPGAVLRLGARDRTAAARSSMLELRVIGGPDAGLAIDLPVGTKSIGRAPDCDLVLTDPDVSRDHARIRTAREVVAVETCQPTNRCTIDDAPIGPGPMPLRPGQVMRLGDSFLVLAGPDEPPVHTELRDGRILIARRGSQPSAESTRDFTLPDAPQPPRRVAAAIVPTVVALVSGVAIALVIRSMQLLIMNAAMPVAALGASVGEWLYRRRAARRRAQDHHRELSRVETEIQAAMRAEATQLRERFPDVVALQRISTRRSSRLWERLPSDPHLLAVRVGTGDRASQVTITSGNAPTTRTITSVPIVADLGAGHVCVTGPPGQVVKLVAYLLCQLATLCSPEDVELIGVFAPHRASRWLWLRWLPHVRRTPAMSMADQEALAAHLSDISVRRRAHTSDTRQHRRLVLLIDTATEGLHPGLAHVLATSSAASHVVGVDVAGPSGGVMYGTTVDIHGETGSRIRVRTSAGVVDAVADLMQAGTADSVARALAPLVDRADADRDASVSGGTHSGLLDLLQLSAAPSSADIARRWAAVALSAPRAAIGFADGVAVQIDLERDGPHALVAGTTGSGKSECLQTLIASLAATHPPDHVTFLLVDYKGGAAFAGCSRLPHVAGLVTDLDPALTQRALSTLEGELRRRERLLAAHGVATFAHYSAGADSPALPRLIIIVDEFAALADDAPDLLRGLVGVAQRGRSLGLHLILATQRPGGVVSAEIRANASLRIALRMTDPSDSLDVIGTDRAADIDPRLPGRAIISRAGAMETVQFARVSGRTVHPTTTPSVVRLRSWRVAPPPQRAEGDGRDDLTVLVEAIEAAARETTRPNAEPPWLPPLPATLPASALPEPARRGVLHIGLVDLPADRAQPPATIDLARGGVIVIAGSARTGKTTAAVAIAKQAARQVPSGELGIITIGRDVAPLAQLTNRSSALDASDFADTAAALHRLKAELCGGRSASHYLLLILDGWDQFVSTSDDADLGRSVDTVLQICRRAHSARCTVVITGDRSVLTPRITGIAHCVYALRLTDRADYGLLGIPRNAVPDHLPPGRALLAPDGHQVQLALPPEPLIPCADNDDRWAARTSP